MRTSPLLPVAALIGTLAVAACNGASSTPAAGDQGCTSCHGDATRPGSALEKAAPPMDAHGQTSAAVVTVGAHQAHLTHGVACSTCHVVPAAGDTTHVVGPYASVTFSGYLVGAQGAAVAPWNRDQPTCANYCHGGFTNGNRATVTWNSTTAMTCNSCHGATAGATASLPTGTHPQGNPDCSACHLGYTTTTVNPTTHLNGQFDLNTLSCTSCHGDSSRAGTPLQQAAPPRDSHGETAVTLVTVGAHQAHLDNGVACTTCHVVPPAGDTTHSLDPFAAVAFTGNVVGANGTPVAPWDRSTATCANYCHNPALGGTVPTPLWTRATPLDCGACHHDQQTAITSTGLHDFHLRTLPPPATLDCSSCHGAGYAVPVVSGAALLTHADGQLQTLPSVGWLDPVCVGPRTCYATCHTVQACRYWP
jgi:predicted CxxxxCH...CXXCH cytochrome family protein